MHIWQPGFTDSTSVLSSKSKERIYNLKQTGASRYIYQSKLHKPCFQHGMTCDFKELTRRTASDRILHDKAFNMAKNPKYDWYQNGLAWMVYKPFWSKNFCYKCK